ncbi:hypothetical protein [Microbacterium sp. CFBP 8794]|uniref:hypothetical protein n=1 Tax=Microbacterium sp. CFBP 8794 TaxID=2775269 RepID=UPI0017853DF5|nr:hypothetical protein [Microbacterium sp. CFBP 8794]MBD8477602.1 hypothetical protein [Microbacterium sp. CFBP 8794]
MNDIHPAVAATLRAIIGLEVDNTDALHQKLAATITDLGPGATYGQRIVALRFDFVWELRDAGKVYGEAKGDYEGTRSRRVVEITETALAEGRKVTLGLAEHMAEAELYELKLTYLVAEQRERAMRKFLDALDAALDNHRTDRADSRAVDRATAQGFGGGA